MGVGMANDCGDAGMTVRHHCGSVDEGLSLEATSGVTPPLLPTLVVALVLGAASLLCREPDAPTSTAPTTAISTTLAPRSVAEPRSVVEPVTTGSIAETFVPATLAFPRQFPLVLTAQAVAPPQASARRPAAPRVATLRRTPPAKPPVPAEAVRGEAAPADPIAGIDTASRGASDDSMPNWSLPDLALPFAPAIETAGRVRDFVGGQGAMARTQATALSVAVVEVVEALR